MLALISAVSLAACTPESPPLDPPDFTLGTIPAPAPTEENNKETNPSETSATTVTTKAASGTSDTFGIQQTPASEDSDSKQKNADRWHRRYKHTGGERDAGYEDYILVEYNQKDNYVSMQMMFMGVNAYMSVDSVGLVPQDGEYWIQDFMNADGTPPELTKVYMKYSDPEIILYYWDDYEKKFDFEYGQHFAFEEEF